MSVLKIYPDGLHAATTPLLSVVLHRRCLRIGCFALLDQGRLARIRPRPGDLNTL